MNIYIPNLRLPSEYQEVEYIESSGTQYIDTGLKVADGYIIKCDTMILSTNVYHCLGGYLGYINGTYWRLYGGTQNNNKRTYGFLNTAAEAGTYNLNEKFNWELSTISGNMYFKWNGTTLGSSTQTYSDSPTGNIGILAYYADDVSGKWHKGTARMYDYQIYDNTNTIIRDFVPCYRKSDSVIGMYDLVNDQFYTNSGTGTFSKGNDVTISEVQNIYIGEYKGFEYSYDFRNKTKAEAESDGWVFDSATYGFSSNGIYKTGSGTGYVRYTADISSYKTLKLSGTGTVSGTYTGISLIGGTTSVGFVNWLYRPSGLGVFYNDANHYVGSALGYGDFSWEIEIDLDTGDLTSSCSNGQTIAGTLNSSYLSALKQSNTTIGIGFNDDNGYIQTFNAQAIPA